MSRWILWRRAPLGWGLGRGGAWWYCMECSMMSEGKCTRAVLYEAACSSAGEREMHIEPIVSYCCTAALLNGMHPLSLSLSLSLSFAFSLPLSLSISPSLSIYFSLSLAGVSFKCEESLGIWAVPFLLELLRLSSTYCIYLYASCCNGYGMVINSVHQVFPWGHVSVCQEQPATNLSLSLSLYIYIYT